MRFLSLPSGWDEVRRRSTVRSAEVLLVELYCEYKLR